jgi:hypothetical protein
MTSLVVGSNRPHNDGEAAAHERGWQCAVHAVDPLQDIEPVLALCGVSILYRYPEALWPPSIDEHCCPACVRLTEQRLT